MFTPEAETWYIVVTCANCKRTVFLFPDLNKGKGSLDANYIVTCPVCNHKGAYSAQHYYHRNGHEDYHRDGHKASAS